MQENFDFFTQSKQKLIIHKLVIQLFLLGTGKDMQRMINTHVEASKIGRQIAEQVMDSQRRGELSSDSSPDPDPESTSMPIPTAEVKSLMLNSLNRSLNDFQSHISTSVQQDNQRHNPIMPSNFNIQQQTFNHVRNNVALAADPGTIKSL